MSQEIKYEKYQIVRMFESEIPRNICGNVSVFYEEGGRQISASSAKLLLIISLKYELIVCKANSWPGGSLLLPPPVDGQMRESGAEL